jgi:DNA-binding transcriptional ArsR family regulator
MVEKIKHINNPLTIIAIFAALAEIAGTVAIAFVQKELQIIFIWYVMGFPTVLVALFFLTLNFNPKVLYAPSDFQNEENFLNILLEKKKIDNGLTKLQTDLEKTKEDIIQLAVKEIDLKNTNTKHEFMNLINNKINSLQESVENTKKESDDLVGFKLISYNSHLQSRILNKLTELKIPVPITEICKETGYSQSAVNKALEKLTQRRLVIQHEVNNQLMYESSV